MLLVAVAWILGLRFGDGFVWPYVYIFFSSALVLSGANAVNNALDSERDSPLKQNPVASGDLTRRNALLIGLGLTVLGLIFSAMIELKFFLAALGISILLLFYNLFLKDRFLIGNLTVASISGFLFIYIGWFFGLNEKFFIAAIFAFLTHLIREIIKDLEDYDSDKNQFAKTMAIKMGKKKSALIVQFLLLMVLIGLYWPFHFDIMGMGYIVFALIGVLPLIITVSVFLWKANYRRAQKMMKILMLLGLVALFIG